jgi:hypothetical protein
LGGHFSLDKWWRTRVQFKIKMTVCPSFGHKNFPFWRPITKFGHLTGLVV